MRLTFTKGAGKHDFLNIDRDGQTIETIECPKQGILPHDMIHYAVESVLPCPGFLSLLHEGRPAGFSMGGDSIAEAIERIVEIFQAEMWSGPVPATDLLEMFEHGCGAETGAIISFTEEDVGLIRSKLAELTTLWESVSIKGKLTVNFSPPVLN